MKSTIAIIVLTLALYRQALYEDAGWPPNPATGQPWYPDPIVRHSNADLPCEIIQRNEDGTVDVVVTGDDGRQHLRLRQPVIVGPVWDSEGSGVRE